jgi:hypothetical protein
VCVKPLLKPTLLGLPVKLWCPHQALRVRRPCSSLLFPPTSVSINVFRSEKDEADLLPRLFRIRQHFGVRIPSSSDEEFMSLRASIARDIIVSVVGRVLSYRREVPLEQERYGPVTLAFIRRLVDTRLSHRVEDPLLGWDNSTTQTGDAAADCPAPSGDPGAGQGSAGCSRPAPLCPDRKVQVVTNDNIHQVALLMAALPRRAQEMILADYVEHMVLEAMGIENGERFYRECFL